MTAPVIVQEKSPLDLWRDKYYHRPVEFVREVLGLEPYSWQVEFMTAVARGQALPIESRQASDRQFSLRSGHRVGKSTALGWLALWFLLTRWRVKVIVTAPTADQLFDALFAEMKSSARRLPPDLLLLLDIKTDMISLKASAEDAFIAAATSRAETPEAMQGKHSDNVMLIGDEASGIPEAVYNASAGSMASQRACMILASNPIRSSGTFFETQTRLSDQWSCFHISSLDIENVDWLWVEGMKLKHGEESDEYRIRVLGEFPRTDADTIIPLWMVEESIGRDILGEAADTQFWGCDVARMGTDSTALVKRTHRALLGVPDRFRGMDTTQVSAQLDRHFHASIYKPAEIMVDVIGWGAGVVDRSRLLKLPVMGINSSMATTVSKEESFLGAGYANLRAQNWFTMRGWFETCAMTMPGTKRGTPDYETMARFKTELTSVKYKFTDSGKLLVESKEDLRKRKIGSPDMADAMALTFGGRAAILAGEGRYKARKSVKRVRKGIV